MQCPACRHENPTLAKFCLECGARVTPSAAAILAPAASPEAFLPADRLENAHARADRAVSLALGRGERGNEAWALRLLGDIASHHDHPDAATAEAQYGAAMTLASELDMRPLVAHCHLGLGRLYRQTGNSEQAQEQLTAARAMYSEMGMTRWLEKLEECYRI